MKVNRLNVFADKQINSNCVKVKKNSNMKHESMRKQSNADLLSLTIESEILDSDSFDSEEEKKDEVPKSIMSYDTPKGGLWEISFNQKDTPLEEI